MQRYTQANANGGVQRSNAQAAPSSGKGATMLVPFEKASKYHTEAGPQWNGVITTANQSVPLNVPVYGYLDTIYLEVTCVNAGNSANVAFNADAPWNVFSQINVRDTNGTPIQNMSGWDFYLAAKFGGYRLFRPEGSAGSFSTVTGTGATGGSFTFVLPINIQFGRGALGVLPNMDASAVYVVDMTLNTLANVYSTLPNGTNTITVRLNTLSWSNPAPIDQFGNQVQRQPSLLGTVQYWSKQSFALTTGENTVLLQRVGNLVRNHHLVFRTAAGVRSDTVRPDTIQWEWDAMVLYNSRRLELVSDQYRNYGFDPEIGHYPYPYVGDPDKVPVGEYTDGYLPTLGTTKLLLRFTPGTAGVLDVLTNDVNPSGDLGIIGPPIVAM